MERGDDPPRHDNETTGEPDNAKTSDTPTADDGLQFDRVVGDSSSGGDGGATGASCAGCRTLLRTEYYDVNGHVFCDRCRRSLETAVETPRGAAPFVIAGAFGLAAGIVGAAIYYAVIAFAHLEIGIVAILIGYMVGYAVRRGAGGRGGRRFQVLAMTLTYVSIALAYTPVVLGQLRDRPATQTSSANSGAPAPRDHAPATADGVGTSAPAPRRVGGIVAVGFLALFIASLPILVIVNTLPSGLISAFIIVIGMRQAWRMTGTAVLRVRGPYRVGVEPSVAP